MIELAEAQARLFALRHPVETVALPLTQAVGRWAATDIVALRTQPARNLSSMDGYALCSIDGAGPRQIVGESAAGRRFSGAIAAGEAVRIFTGAIVPDGADAVVIQENAVRIGDTLELTDDTPVPGQNIRHAGADFVEGATLVSAGAPVTAACVGLLAMAGHATIMVRRKLRVALISTGDELVPPGTICSEEQIPSSNASMLAAMLAHLPVEIDDRGIVGDRLDDLTNELSHLQDADIIVTIGGASVGDHDLVRPALKAAGADIDFWKIAMRPGKPVMAGTLGKAVVLGLPGNPVSAFVTAVLLLKPLIAHLGGARDPLPPRITARLAAALPANGNRLDHIRGILTASAVVPTGVNDSSMLSALSQSNVLIIRDIHAPEANVGEPAECIIIR